MSASNGVMKRIAKLGLVLMMSISISACAEPTSVGGSNWNEEVLLHDGSKIIVEREVKRGGRHELGQRPSISDQSLSFVLPDTNQRVIWKDEYSVDVDGANFNPMLLEIVNSSAYVLGSPAGCLSYNKWGRPNPPYVAFRYQDKKWDRITMQELPVKIRLPNLVISSPDDVAKNAKRGLLSVEMIKQANEGFSQPEFQIILREAYAGAGRGCIKTDYYGTAGWLSPDWFTDQPSLNACLKFCDQKKISTEACPCTSIFKGK